MNATFAELLPTVVRSRKLFCSRKEGTQRGTTTFVFTRFGLSSPIGCHKRQPAVKWGRETSWNDASERGIRQCRITSCMGGRGEHGIVVVIITISVTTEATAPISITTIARKDKTGVELGCPILPSWPSIERVSDGLMAGRFERLLVQ